MNVYGWSFWIVEEQEEQAFEQEQEDERITPKYNQQETSAWLHLKIVCVKEKAKLQNS